MKKNEGKNGVAVSGFAIIGNLTIKLKRDECTHTRVYKNLVMKDSLIDIASYIAGNSLPENVITHFAIGNGTVPPTEIDTELESETYRSPAVITQGSSDNANKVEFKVEHSQGAVIGDVSEAGLFSADTNGDMFNRVVFTPFTAGSADTLTFIWEIEVKNV